MIMGHGRYFFHLYIILNNGFLPTSEWHNGMDYKTYIIYCNSSRLIECAVVMVNTFGSDVYIYILYGTYTDVLLFTAFSIKYARCTNCMSFRPSLFSLSESQHIDILISSVAVYYVLYTYATTPRPYVL